MLKIKTSVLYFLLFSISLVQSNWLNAQKFEPVKKVSEFNNFYQSGNYYFSGQPNLEALKWIKSEGVSLVINLRSDIENKEFSKNSFNEEAVLKDLGINYVSIAMKGRDAYSKQTLDKFAKEMSVAKGKVLIHCKGAGRVTYVMMAYLIKHKNYTVDEAIEFGKQLTYFSPLEGLLNSELTIDVK